MVSTFRRFGAVFAASAILFSAMGLKMAPSALGAPPASSGITIAPATRSVGDAKRFALVIGNATYQHFGALKNPINDARAVSERLRDLGYEVLLALDLDRANMNGAIDRFLNRIEPGSEILVYYAGHGVEVQGSNYLLPIDIAQMGPDQERRLRSDAINLSDLLTDVQQRKARMMLVIIDACRENPFPAAGTRSLGGTRGLGKVDPPRGTFVMFSAGVGETALDDLGSDDRNPNGPFTTKLLRLMNQEGLELHEMTIRLREEVRTAALGINHQQFLAYYDELTGQFYFRPPSMRPPAENACDVLVNRDASQAAVLASDTDAAAQACTRALSEFPAEVRFAHLLIAAQENRAFKQAMTGQDKAAAQLYMMLYPQGRFVDAVRAYLVALGPVPSPAPAPTPPPVVHAQEITRVLQTELQRVGCYAGSGDGIWGPAVADALKRFNQRAGARLNVQLASLEAITAVRERTGRVCPLTCPSGQRAEGERCVAATCQSGFVLASNGQCIRQQVRREVRPPSPSPSPSPVASPVQPPRAAQRCVKVGDTTFCE